MINSFRLLSMIKLARYEEKGGGKDIRICRYYRGDYVGMQMIKTFFLTTFAYVLVLALIIAADFERYLDLLDEIDLVQVGIWVVFFYALVLFIFVQLTWILAGIRYDNAKTEVRHYSKRLVELNLLGQDGKDGTAGRKGAKRTKV